MFKPGERVAEHLELVRLLGSGGMGSVWVAEHLRLRTRVAVKFLSASMLNNTLARSRFDREAQLVAQVKSPHVVQVLDQGVTHSAQPFIVMELLEGEDLARLLERRGALPLAEAVVILDQVCAGLAAAHAVGLVHRDIKPDNIFIMSGVRPFAKILDFGVARTVQQDPEAHRLTSTGGVVGTAHYMSPEQLFEGKNVDLRTDVWALGVVTYRMLTGRLPFDGTTYGDLCLRVNQGVYPPPSQYLGTNPELDAFVARALAKAREQRFSSVKEFADELNALAQRQSGLPVQPVAASGSVKAVTEPSMPTLPETTGRRSLSSTERMLTGPGATLTVAATPPRTSHSLLYAGLAALSLLGIGGVAVLHYWPPDPGIAPPPSAAPLPAASSASTHPPPEPPAEPESTAPAEPIEKADAGPDEGSNAKSDVKASELRAAPGKTPANAPARVTSRHFTAPASEKPDSNAKATAPQQQNQTPQQKYRGF